LNTALPRLSHVEVIARVQTACDDLIEAVTHNHRPPVSCREGCDWCCRQPVYITPLEGVAIREFVVANRMEKRVQYETERYLAEIATRRQGPSGLAALHKSVLGMGPPPTDRQRRGVYGPKCIFLNPNGLCSIYPARPLMCREHISFDAVRKCERDEPFLGLDKPRFSEVTSFLTQRSVEPRHRMLPIWEYERSAALADAAPEVKPGELKKALRLKIG
jgi:Fe-S-cluster containining protein